MTWDDVTLKATGEGEAVTKGELNKKQKEKQLMGKKGIKSKSKNI